MPRNSPETKSYLAFPVPEDLRSRTEDVIAAIRKSSAPKELSDDLAEVVVELTRTGLESYFIAPLKRAKVNAVALGSAKVTVATAGKSLPLLVRRVAGMLSGRQIIEIAEFLDESLLR